MIKNEIISIFLCASLSVIIFVELVLFLPVTKYSLHILEMSQKAFSVLKTSNVSDRWKEKILPFYSGQILKSSLIVTFFLILLLLCFAGTFYSFGLVIFENKNEIIKSFSSISMQVVAILMGMLYGILRKGVTASKSKSDTDYNFSSKLLHHITLGSNVIKEMAFDADCLITKMQSVHPIVSSPVYITGLARAGTTILLESLYSTGAFTSLTYRDMPLVTAPYIWSKITKDSKIVDASKKERAHGDNIYVNYDSPEAFEEVFWMTFSSKKYVKKTHLEMYEVEIEVIENYRKYIQNIIIRHGKIESVRYLAKNNNNLLRINAIKSAFPDAIIIVPFRNPVNHARSLLNQHKKFLERHSQDRFSMKYMNWLGHFEFGANVKLFKVQQDEILINSEDLIRLDFWLSYWESVYRFIIDHYASNVHFFNYDKLCEQPEEYFAKLESNLILPDGSLRRFSSKIKPAKKYKTGFDNNSIPSQVKNVYFELQDLSL